MNNNNFKSLFYKSQLQSIKINSYFNIYESIFKEFRNKPITFVEVGVFGGGSLFMWKNYFHSKSRIIGIDLNPEAKSYEKYGFEIFIGDQQDEKFWKKFYNKVGKINILLDDGGHTDLQQTQTLVSSIKNIKEDGIIVIEDVHASYLTEFGNPSKNSFVNYSKKIIDLINFRYSGLNKFNDKKNKLYHLLKNNIYSVSFYESIISFRINNKKSITSKAIWNKKKIKKIFDFRYKKKQNYLWQSIIYLKKKIPSIIIQYSLIKNFALASVRYIINRDKNKKFKKYLI